MLNLSPVSCSYQLNMTTHPSASTSGSVGGLTSSLMASKHSIKGPGWILVRQSLWVLSREPGAKHQKFKNSRDTTALRKTSGEGDRLVAVALFLGVWGWFTASLSWNESSRLLFI